MNIGFTILCLVMICIFTASREDRRQARAWFRRHNGKFLIACAAVWSLVISLYLLGSAARP